MNPKKQSPRKTKANKLEPIDWREFANDAVLNGNMSTLYRRPPSEDPSAYASPEAMLEIEKRVSRPAPDSEPTEAIEPANRQIPTVGVEPTVALKFQDRTVLAVGLVPAVGATPTAGVKPAGLTKPTGGPQPTAGTPNKAQPTEATTPTLGISSTVESEPTASSFPTAGLEPTVGLKTNKKIKPIRTIHDALTLAGQVLYTAMLGSPDAARTTCTKGYRQLAAETHLDKDTVRDLIVEFKQKGILHETATYDPDTRLPKTYEVLAPHTVLQAWNDSGILFVTAGRQRPLFCSASGNLITFIPTVGPKPIPEP